VRIHDNQSSGGRSVDVNRPEPPRLDVEQHNAQIHETQAQAVADREVAVVTKYQEKTSSLTDRRTDAQSARRSDRTCGNRAQPDRLTRDDRQQYLARRLPE
jgi:hypothetical protein